MHMCVFCGDLFNNRKQEATHRNTTHINKNSESSLDSNYQLPQPKRRKQLEQYQKQANMLNCNREGCKFETIDQISLLNHGIRVHCDLDLMALQTEVISINNQLITINREEKEMLINEQIFQREFFLENKQSFNNYDTKDSVLLIKYRDKLISAAKFRILETKLERYCIIEKTWCKKLYKIELFILFDELSSMMTCQRVTEIFYQINYSDLAKYSSLKFFQVEDNNKFSKILSIQQLSDEMQLVSRKTKCSLTSLIPDVKTPMTNYSSQKAETLRDFIQLIKQRGIVELLKEYLQLQIKRSGISKNQKANRTDQAITTNLVFQRISRKLLVTKSNMFDCCPFVPDWDAKSHYNSLKQPWHGEFVWCNPPYSQTSQFITKAFIEFLDGKSVIMLIPELRKHDGFVHTLLTLCGDVHKQGLIRFDPYRDVVQTSIQLIYLIQPDHIGFLEAYHKHANKTLKPKPYVSLQSLQQCGQLDKEKEDNTVRLLRQGLSITQACMLTGVSRKRIEILLKQLKVIPDLQVDYD